MPALPEWFQRVPEIEEQIAALDVPVVDRAIIERVFGISRRQAIEVMHRFGGFQAGRTFLIARSELLAGLSAIEESADYLYEKRRKEQLASALETARCHQAAARIKIAVRPGAREKNMATLPEGVSLAAGALQIKYEQTEDLLQKLYELSQAIANDFESFERVTQSSDESTKNW